MKNILILNGSFRVGNTAKTLEPVKKILRTKKELEIREFMIKELIDTTCHGCALAITKGKKFCPTYEKEKELIDQLNWCDGLIIASPVYNGRETFIIKTLFDKFAYLVHRPRYFDKKAMVLVTRGSMFRDAGRYMSKVLGQWGFDVTVKCGEPELPVLKENLIQKTEDKIIKKTEQFYNSLEKNKPVPGIGKKIWFEVWKINVTLGREWNRADYDYWQEKGWLEKSYYYDTSINFFGKVISAILNPVIKRQMKRTFKGY